MTSQTGQQIITIYILPNISRSKDNQAMEFGHLIKYSVRNNFFFKNHVEKWVGRLVPDLFLFFKNVLYKIKASAQRFRFNIFW